MEHEDVILNEMEDTRTSLSEKLETLEKQVTQTVQGATSGVKDTVETVTDSVQDTVAAVKETVKETVEETVNTVKESVQETVNTVKETVQDSVHAVRDLFDVPKQVDRHPWVMMAGSVGLGYCLGNYFAPPRSTYTGSRIASPTHYTGPSKQAFATGPSQTGNGNGHRETNGGVAAGMASAASTLASSAFGAAPGLLGTLMHHFEPEINRLKGLALGMVMNSVRDAVMRSVPHHLSEPVGDLLDSVSDKIGAQKLHDDHGEHGHHGHEHAWGQEHQTTGAKENVAGI